MAGLGRWYIEVQKQAFWRGNNKTWMNRYVMSGTPPGPSTIYSITEALMAIETKLYPATPGGEGVGFVKISAYGPDGGPPIYTNEINPSKAPGTASGFGGATWSGSSQEWASTLEICMLLETPLNAVSSRGKPVYLRKYYRGAQYGADEDFVGNSIPTADQNGIKAAVAPLFNGLGGTSYYVVAPSANLPASAPTVHPFLVSHQMPRGKKRKVSVALDTKTSSNLLNSALKGLAEQGAKYLLDAAPLTADL